MQYFPHLSPAPSSNSPTQTGRRLLALISTLTGAKRVDAVFHPLSITAGRVVKGDAGSAGLAPPGWRRLSWSVSEFASPPLPRHLPDVSGSLVLSVHPAAAAAACSSSFRPAIDHFYDPIPRAERRCRATLRSPLAALPSPAVGLLTSL